MPLTWQQVLSWRQRRHLLDRAEPVSAVDVARRLVGVQAQVMSSAEQAVGRDRRGGDLGARARPVDPGGARAGHRGCHRRHGSGRAPPLRLGRRAQAAGLAGTALSGAVLGRHGDLRAARRPDLHVPSWPGLPDAGEAGPRVVERYLAVHGPASQAAFDQWLLRGATPEKVLRGWFEQSRSDGRIVAVDVEGDLC